MQIRAGHRTKKIGQSGNFSHPPAPHRLAAIFISTDASMVDPNSSPPPASADLLKLLAAGDENAAAAIFERYADRLTRLARSRLASRLAARVDAEDIVMSAYRSFFVAARQGRFELERGGDLWRLLVEVTLHKLYRSAAHHQAQRRSVEREHPISPTDSRNIAVAHSEPTPDEALAAAEELEAVLARLPERGRQALELRLQAFELEEIAVRLACNERSVRRWLNEAGRILVARGGKDFVPSAARSGKRILKRQPARAIPITSLGTRVPLVWTDYVLREQIGAGATGKVYRAFEKQQHREVAVKFLKKSLLTSPATIERFVREASTVAELNQPGIVPVHGIGQTPGGGLFLAMDLVRGRDLDSVRRAGPLGPARAAAWVASAARTVHRAHECGIIHCDLKPGNLLLDQREQIWLTDFGLAIRLADVEGGVLAGTPAFMAPEQIDPCWGPISARTDVWGLGSVLYFLLFARPPHGEGNLANVLADVVSGAPVPFPTLPSDLAHEPVFAVARRCLAKPPADRFATALQLAEALDQSPSVSGG
jgi:eukaryotic-like serine/threonine-protein kinase